MIRNNSKWWRNILVPKGRASQLEYNLLCLIFTLPLALIVYLDYNHVISIGKMTYAMEFLLCYVIVMLWVMLCATIRRNHDMSNSGLSRASLTGVEFMFRKGETGPNRFGSDPLQDYDSQINELKEA